MSTPQRGDIVQVEKVADQMYRITDKQGEPTLVGLFNTPENAEKFCKEHGWRPVMTGLVTGSKKVKRLAKPDTLGLDL